MLKKSIVVIYARVSTSKQSTKSQIIQGRELARSLGFAEDQIVEFLDDGVSSRKLSIHEREGLSKLLEKIRNNEVTHIIVADRDRLARNMVEYLTIIAEITKHNVKLLFSGKGVTPFTNDFGLEAYLALFAESEGIKINERSNGARKYYPNKLYGYERKGNGSSTHYVPNNEQGLQNVISIFSEFNSINNLEEYKLMKIKWRKNINRDITKILSNPFYAACILNDDSLETVYHIQSIISDEEILNNIRTLKDWGLIGNNNTLVKELILEQMDLKVFCDICNKELNQSKYNNTYVFRCNHGDKKSKNKIKIPYSNVIEAVVNTLNDLSKTLDINFLQEVCIDQLYSTLNTLNHDISSIDLKIRNLNSNIMISLENYKVLTEKLEKHQKLEEEMEDLLTAKKQVKTWILDIKQFTKSCIQSNVYNYIQKNPHEAAQFLIHSIKLNCNSIDILHYFDSAYREAN